MRRKEYKKQQQVTRVLLSADPSSTPQGMVPVEEKENVATPPAASEACSGLAEQEERAPTTSASQHGEYAAPTFEIVISQ